MTIVQNPYPIVERVNVLEFVQSYWAPNPLNEQFSSDPMVIDGLQFQIDSGFRYVVFKYYDRDDVLQSGTIMVNDQRVPPTPAIQTANSTINVGK